MDVYAVSPPGYGLSLAGMNTQQVDCAMADIAQTVVEILAESECVDVVAAVREAVFRTGYRLQDVLASINYSAGLDLFLSDDIRQELKAIG